MHDQKGLVLATKVSEAWQKVLATSKHLREKRDPKWVAEKRKNLKNFIKKKNLSLLGKPAENLKIGREWLKKLNSFLSKYKRLKLDFSDNSEIKIKPNNL